MHLSARKLSMFLKSIYSFLSQHWLVANVIRVGAAGLWCHCWGSLRTSLAAENWLLPPLHKKRVSKPFAKNKCATLSQGPAVSWVQVAKILHPTSDIPESLCAVEETGSQAGDKFISEVPLQTSSGLVRQPGLSHVCPALPGMWSAPHSPTGAHQLPEILLWCLTPAGYSALCSCSLTPLVGLRGE